MASIVYIVQDAQEGLRIDKFLAEQNDNLTRSYIQKLIKDGCLKVNHTNVRSSYQVRENDAVCFEVPADQEPEILPENIPLEILYEDADVIVVNKPKGMVVHPAAGHYTGTLVNALMYHCTDLSGINGILRPGIVHRIDKDTSGVLVCAKNDAAHKFLAEQFQIHSINRIYEAICLGTFKNEAGTVEGSIGRDPNDRKRMSINEKNGKRAITHYRILTQYERYAHMECRLETGRTHQIRVHMASIHHPLLGDTIYGGKSAQYKLHGKDLDGQTLHARLLGFQHPTSGNYLEFEAPRPQYFEELLQILR